MCHSESQQTSSKSLDEDNTMDSQFEKVKKELQCVIHLEIRKGPIYSCGENCHLLCQNCLREIQGRDKKCPMCRVDLLENPQRDYAIERIIAQLELPEDCANCTLGCMFRGNQAEVNEHQQKECQFKQVYCPDLWCQKVLPLNGLLKHLEEANKDEHVWHARPVMLQFEGNVVTFKVTGGYRQAKLKFPHGMAKWQEHTLFPMIYKKGNIYHLWMYLLGDEDAANGFPDIKISLEGPRSSVMLKTRVFSVRVSLKDVLSDLDAMLSLTKFQVWQCVKWMHRGVHEKELQFKYEILSHPPTVQDIVEGPGLRIHSKEERQKLKSLVDEAMNKKLDIGDKWYFLNSHWFGPMTHYLEGNSCWSRQEFGALTHF